MKLPISRRIGTAVLAGLIGAVTINLYLVVVEAWILHVATPVQISQWDASNILGVAAFNDGLYSAGLGLLLHVVVSLCWATLYLIVALSNDTVARHPWISGTAFGFIVMFAMRLIVVLGHASLAPLSVGTFFMLLIAHTLFFAIPVALVASKTVSVAKR